MITWRRELPLSPLKIKFLLIYRRLRTADGLSQTKSQTRRYACNVHRTQIIGSHLNHAWFVAFDISNEQTGEKRRIQKRGQINYYKTIEERKSEADRCLKFWKKRLKEGWHPFADTEARLVNKFTPFHAAIDFAFDKCAVSKGTKKAYRTTVKFAKAAIEKLGLKSFPVGDIEHQHILLLLEEIERKERWSHDSYNKHAGYLCSILSRLKQWKVFKENPAAGVAMKAVVETQKYIPYTEAEKKKIREYLYIHHYRFFVYIMVLYHTGIRPKEILCLKVGDIDFDGGIITIYPDLEEENSKTKKIRHVPVNNHLMPFFERLELTGYPKEFYLFGSPYEAGKGNKGSAKGGRSGAAHPEYFKPSPVQIKRDTVTKFWNRIVMQKLGVKKHLYAAKHTGCDEKILAGMTLIR